MACRLAELQGGVAAVFGGRLITGVELQGGKQGRQPASGHQQLLALGQIESAGVEPSETSQPCLYAGDQQSRWRTGIAAAESVHGQVDVLQGASADVGGFCFTGQLDRLNRAIGGCL